MEKTFKIIMLPTEQKENFPFFIDTSDNNTLCLNAGLHKDKWNYDVAKPQHLYIISDCEIKEGDWYIYQFGDSPEIIKCEDLILGDPNKRKNCNKIVATTNKSLTISKSERTNYGNEETYNTYNHKSVSLPQLPESFIQAYIKAYNEGKPITEVELETKQVITLKGNADAFNEYADKIKTNPDNTVIIHEQRFYTKKETIKFAIEFANHCMKQAGMNLQCVGEMMEFEKNL